MDNYIIVRIDHRTVPAIVDYVSPDVARRFTSFRDSAEVYTRKREAVREAQRLSRLPFWPGQWKVIAVSTRVCVFDSAA